MAVKLDGINFREFKFSQTEKNRTLRVIIFARTNFHEPNFLTIFWIHYRESEMLVTPKTSDSLNYVGRQAQTNYNMRFKRSSLIRK